MDLQRKGTEALDANRYWIAEPLLKQAVTESEKLGFNHPYLAKSLGELGRYYTVRGKFAQAEPFLERELAVKETMLDKDGGQTIESMGALIKFYLAYGTESKADPLGADVLAFVEGKAREPREMAQSKTTQAKDAPLVGWLGTAAANERNPIIEWAITCDSIGGAFKYKGKYDMAEKLYKAALDLKARVLGEGHLSLAGSYDSLGILCMERGEYKEAESYFRDALITTEKTLTPDYPEVYARLDRLAKCLIKEKKFAEAEELYKRAFGFWRSGPSKGGDEARAVFALGMLNMEQHKYSAAASYFRRSLAMAEKFSGRSSLVLYPHLQNYAYCLYHLGARGECSRLRARANAIAGDFYKKPEEEKKEVAGAKIAGGKKGTTADQSGRKRRHRSAVASRYTTRKHRRHRR
ncbi:MAG: tetratricopeptide repeat protein [Candidatus Obscuribacterales bacterium]|nr:tetratricopeptide repeat protein [Candidatus Obscuribacterales bacterium]